MKPEQIVITGIGVVSPIGVGPQAYQAALAEQRSGIGPLTLFDASALPAPLAAEVRDFDPKKHIKPRKSLKVMSRDIQLACAAAAMAVEDAALAPGQVDPERFGVVFGSDLIYCELEELPDVYRSCITEEGYQHSLWGIKSMEDLYPLWMLKYLPNMAACHVAIAHDARGPNNSLTVAEVSSLEAVAEAARVIHRGLVDAVLVGGGSSRLHPLPLVSRGDEELSHRLEDPASACRPFDRTRDGTVNGEGGAVLLLERESTARARNAEVLARVLSWSSATEPRPPSGEFTGTAIRSTLKQVLERAGRDAGDIGHVNAHGLGSERYDPVEARAIADVLGHVPVTAPKSFFGNLGAAGGVVEMVASILALGKREIPVTLNYREPDPDCPVNVVHDQPATSHQPTAIVMNQTMMGQACAVLLGEA